MDTQQVNVDFENTMNVTSTEDDEIYYMEIEGVFGEQLLISCSNVNMIEWKHVEGVEIQTATVYIALDRTSSNTVDMQVTSSELQRIKDKLTKFSFSIGSRVAFIKGSQYYRIISGPNIAYIKSNPHESITVVFFNGFSKDILCSNQNFSLQLYAGLRKLKTGK